MFGGSLNQIQQRRNKVTRKPANLPQEKTVEVLNANMKKIMSPPNLSYQFPMSIFVDVRDAACARLTIYNGRRGGEPARLFLYQWQEAVNGTWLREETRERYKNEIETGNRITFQEGKGHMLVPVFIPPDVVPGMEFLSSELVRRDSTIK